MVLPKDSLHSLPSSSTFKTTPSVSIAINSPPTTLNKDSILVVSLHLCSHYRQEILPQQTPSTRTSQRSNKRTSQRPNIRTWHSHKFHDDSLFTHAFLTQTYNLDYVKEALTNLDAFYWQNFISKENKSLVDNHT